MRPLHDASLLLLLLSSFAPTSVVGGITGRVVDSTLAPVPNTTVRLFDSLRKQEIARASADENGNFALTRLLPGAYAFEAYAPGFRVSVRPELRISANETTPLGDMILQFAGCDAPTVSCSPVVPHPPVYRVGIVRVPLHCGADLLRGRPVCRTAEKRTADLQWTTDPAGTPTLVADARSRLSPYNSTGGACNSAPLSDRPLPTTTYGPGYDFCVRTRTGRLAHVFVAEEINPDATSIVLYFVTR